MNLQDYIILPGEVYNGKDLLVAKQRTHKNFSWKQAHITLQEKNAFMLPPRVFFHFLRYINEEKVYNGKGNRVSDEEKLQILHQYTDEWLDAHFTELEGVLYLERSHLLKGNVLTPQISNRYVDLATNRIPPNGINLMELILHPTGTGLPAKDIQKGKDYFLSPRLDGVMRWLAEDQKKGIACRKHPDYNDPSVGVRVACLREEIVYAKNDPNALVEKAVA
ncbi:MAG: hypothetical protein Q8R18_04060 [bacterium]|nr:hypothetical protein [bacterium]